MKMTLAVILVAVIAISAFGITTTATAKPFMNWRSTHDYSDSSHRLTERSFVRVNAAIDKWQKPSASVIDVKGTLQVQSRTFTLNGGDIRQGASATLVWKIVEPVSTTQPTSTPNPTSIPTTQENTVQKFFTAKLVETASSSLESKVNKFVLTGKWAIYEVTVTVSKTTDSNGDVTDYSRSQSAKTITPREDGTLEIDSSTNTFTLVSASLGTLSGTVTRQKTSSMQFNTFKINDDATNIVTKSDFASIKKAFGSGLGWGNYDQRMDYNFDYKIDIADITTVAANVNLQ